MKGIVFWILMAAVVSFSLELSAQDYSFEKWQKDKVDSQDIGGFLNFDGTADSDAPDYSLPGLRGPLVPLDMLLSDNLDAVDSIAQRGGIDSFGGGDTVDRRRVAAWFYGTSNISTCYYLTKNFGLNQEQVSAQVLRAFTEWKTYFKSKKINEHFNPPINYNFSLKKECEGDEDLVLYLGTGPIVHNLSDLKARQSLSRPVAYVNKTHLSSGLLWSQGYIRFLEPELYVGPGKVSYPNWSDENNFYFVLLHEIGHVLGFSHKEKTVMTGNLVSSSFFERTPLASIDSEEKELFYCAVCSRLYEFKENTGSALPSEPLQTEGPKNALGSRAKSQKVFLPGDQILLAPKNQIYLIRDGIRSRIQPYQIIYKEAAQSPLLSIFKQEEDLLVEADFYLFNYRGLDFSAVKSGQELSLNYKGLEVARFIFTGESL